MYEESACHHLIYSKTPSSTPNKIDEVYFMVQTDFLKEIYDIVAIKIKLGPNLEETSVVFVLRFCTNNNQYQPDVVISFLIFNPASNLNDI